MQLKKSKKSNIENLRGIFFQLGLIFVLGITLLAFEWSSNPNLNNTLGNLADMELEEEFIPITREQDVKPPPPPPPPTIIEILNIVEDDVEIDDELIIEDIEADQDMEIEIIPFDDEEEVVDDVPFIIVDDMPVFKGGGITGFRNWVFDHLNYPEIAAENGISGKVYVNFTVNKKGDVVNAKVIRGVDQALDKEAIRAIMSSPKWTPGNNRGIVVSVQYTMPIHFQLQ